MTNTYVQQTKISQKCDLCGGKPYRWLEKRDFYSIAPKIYALCKKHFKANVNA